MAFAARHSEALFTRPQLLQTNTSVNLTFEPPSRSSRACWSTFDPDFAVRSCSVVSVFALGSFGVPARFRLFCCPIVLGRLVVANSSGTPAFPVRSSSERSCRSCSFRHFIFGLCRPESGPVFAQPCAARSLTRRVRFGLRRPGSGQVILTSFLLVPSPNARSTRSSNRSCLCSSDVLTFRGFILSFRRPGSSKQPCL